MQNDRNPSKSALTRRAAAPVLNGLAAATLQLPAGDWSTVLDCLCSHFHRISREQWVSRFERRLVLDEAGGALEVSSPYRQGARIHYYREVERETPIPFLESILHVDDHLVVVDKPHFLPVTPVGAYVHETLLSRLRQRFKNFDLVPLHRIDRATAGLVLFSANGESRNAYQALFREQQIEKCYDATAPALSSLSFPVIRRTRIVRGEPFVRSQEVPGEPNAETRLEVASSEGTHWRYRLFPRSGKKHQLRVHLAALGAPIVNDDLYPEMVERAADDFSRPLQLIARSLSFIDPFRRQPLRFESHFRLLD